MAQGLREALKAKSIALTRSESLELIARRFGFLQLEGAVRSHSEKMQKILKKRQMWSRDSKAFWHG